MGFFDFLPWRRRPAQPRKRGYTGALSHNLNTDWRTSSASANSEIYTALRPLRNRSRDLYRNDPYAKSAVNTFVSSVVGKGLNLQAKIEKPRGGMNDRLNSAIEAEWERWAARGNCTPDGRLSMHQLQRLALRSCVVDGEILIRVVRLKAGDSLVPVALELIEVDQLIETGLSRAQNGNRVIMGVELDEWNRPVAYHLYPYHPGDYQFIPQAKFQQTERVPAEEIIHLYVMERPGQVRGVPWLHNVLERIRNISGYEEAEIVRSRIQSCAVGAITSPEPDAMTDYEEGGEDYKFLSPGEILRLAPGETFTMGNAAAPNPSLEGFLRAMARSIAAGIGISYESLTRDYSNTSYSSARTALLAERDLYEVLQTEFCESFLCPFYRKHWLELAVLSGAVPINGYELRPEFFQSHHWTRRGWPWVDPAKDIQASREALQLKMTTLTRELATRGIDIEELFKERAAEIELAKKYGLTIDLEVPPSQGGPAPAQDAGGKIAGEDDDAPLMDGMIPVKGSKEPAPEEEPEEEEERDYPIMEGLEPVPLLLDRAAKGGAKKGKKCTTGQVCGLSCISKTKVCKQGLSDKQKPKAKKAKGVSRKSGGGGATEEKPTLAGTLMELSPTEIIADPKRFQYKIIGEYTKTGEVGSLSGVQKYDPNLAGIIQVWQDPADGKTYVVNGHNRLALANRLGAEKVAVRYLDVKDAKEARAVGALTNIAEGRGTPLDAAKFFNDTGLSKADLDAKGIPMREKIATDGLALSKLEPSLFRQVINGDLSTERGVIIGGSGLDATQQKSLLDLVAKQPKNKNITNEVIKELVDTVSASTAQTSFVLDLFGGSDVTVSNAIERAKLQALIKKKLSTDKKLFGTVSKSKAAKQLESAGNVIDIATSQKISMDAAKTLAIFDSLKNLSGPISAKINEAATAIQNGGNAKKIQSDLYNEISGLVAQGDF